MLLKKTLENLVEFLFADTKYYEQMIEWTLSSQFLVYESLCRRV